MNERLTPPNWDSLDPAMLLNVADAKYYYESFTGVVDERSDKNEQAIGTLGGRVTALEQSTPVGPGGKGAYLNLGGTPERYPTAEEMVAGDTSESTSFLVVARQDGIYFYNPKSKLLIPPKKGGGTVAIHASFPDIFDEGHTIKHDTRIGKSGVYTAKCADVGLDGNFLSYDTAKILVVTTADMEYQTALHPDGTASRTFVPGNNVAPWAFHSGSGGGGGGSVDPVVIQEINRRLAELESKPEPIVTFEGLSDTAVDVVTDVNGLLYLGEDGKVRANPVNPQLGMGHTPINAGSVGSRPAITTGNVSAVVIASSPVIMMTAEANRTATLPNIVPFDTYKPSTTQIREGRVTYFVNSAVMQKTLRVTSGQRFYKDGNMDSANVSVPGKTTYVYNSAILDNGSGAMMECFVFMGQIAHEDADMSTILDGFTQLSAMHDAQQVEINFLRSEQEFGKLTVEGLQAGFTDVVDRLVDVESKVVTKFTEMTDTPSGYQPGKLVGYNMAGDGLTSYDRVSKITDLTDTPNNLSGNATKVMTVKVDETGLEFTDFPRLGPLQTQIDNLAEDVEDMMIVDTSLQASIDELYQKALRVDSKDVTSSTMLTTSDAAAADLAIRSFVGLNGNITRTFRLPGIVPYVSNATPTADECRQGKIITIAATSNGSVSLALSAGQAFIVNGIESTSSRTIPGKTMETFIAMIVNGLPRWNMIARSHTDGSTVGFNGLKTRVEALEAGGGGGGSATFVGLTDTPSSLTAKKILTVNNAGTAIEMSAATTDDLAGALTLAQGVVSGQSLVNPSCIGSEVMETDLADVTGEHVCHTNTIIVGAWRASHNIWLPLVDPYDAYPLGNFSVRSGRLTTIYNGSGSNKDVVIKLDPKSINTRMLGVDGYDISQFVLPAGYGVRFMPMFVSAETEVKKRRWVMLEKFKRLQA